MNSHDLRTNDEYHHATSNPPAPRQLLAWFEGAAWPEGAGPAPDRPGCLAAAEDLLQLARSGMRDMDPDRRDAVLVRLSRQGAGGRSDRGR